MKYFTNIPRWLVLQTDVVVCSIAFVLAYLFRFNFEVPESYFNAIPLALLFVISVKVIFFLIFKSYAGIIRYTSVEDAKRIFFANTSSSAVILILVIAVDVIFSKYYIPRAVVFIDYALSILFMSSFRILAKILYFESRSSSSNAENIAIYGAGEAGVITAKTIHQEPTGQKIVAFFDDDRSKRNSIIEGVKIYHSSDIQNVITKYKIKTVIIAIQNISVEQKKIIVDSCLILGTKVRIIPPSQKWINGELSLKQIKDVKIEDILGRDEINIYNENIHNEIYGKTILVTGAAGSIGSELVRQISVFKPKKIILFDQAETPLYELETELKEMPYKINFETVIGDISNEKRVVQVFDYFKPEYVFHAAAYKHVPLMEENPSEAILVNVLGTKIVADQAVKHQAEKFILVSTDKAVNPTNVMGASKRIAELYTQALNHFLSQELESGTKFIVTRFGNVLGSNGSVIPRFRKQIAEGGPVTITHPDITRYFMTIPEAAKLVLEAASMGKGAEVFLFDMGQPIKIIDLAKKMIALSGYDIGKDIQIQFTGLRPGEKLYEELLTKSENTVPTHHPKIMIGKFEEMAYELIEKEVSELGQLYHQADNKKIVAKMKSIVPEYKSNNSIYEMLD